MTPPAVTAAGRGATTKDRDAGHRRKLRQPPAPRAPRRVSGPVGGIARAGAVARPRSADQPRARPRRLPAPGALKSVPARAAAFVRALPDHALLDRIIRGRSWIPLLGVMLAGIVAMQVEVLKLGASMGRSIEQGTSLQSRNELLRASVVQLADDQRIEALAAGMGMVMPAPDAVNFLAARNGDEVQQAVSNIHTPDATTFLAQLPVSATSPAGTANTAGTTNSAATPVASGTSGAASGTSGAPSGTTGAPTSTGTSGGGTGSSGTTGPSSGPTGAGPSTTPATTPTSGGPGSTSGPAATPTPSPSPTPTAVPVGGAGQGPTDASSGGAAPTGN